jgi:hypothetical protein
MTAAILFIPVMLWLALSAPALGGEQPLKGFCRALVVTAFGVLIPLIVFLLSAFLVPEWKGGCSHGWLDCFHLGKLMLTPLVLWAIGALYILEIHRAKQPYSGGIVLGLFVGVVVAGGCFVYGAISIRHDWSGAVLFLLVPLYAAAWNGIRLAQIVRQSSVGPVTLLLTFIGTIPFWFAGMLWSKKFFSALPDHPPSCFVVTAAGQGHRSFVGPFLEVTHRGHNRIANHQLITLWKLEELWQAHAPFTHKSFRNIYNRVGPVLARRINSPWVADAAYLALKPVEFIAALIVTASNKPK